MYLRRWLLLPVSGLWRTASRLLNPLRLMRKMRMILTWFIILEACNRGFLSLQRTMVFQMHHRSFPMVVILFRSIYFIDMGLVIPQVLIPPRLRQSFMKQRIRGLILRPMVIFNFYGTGLINLVQRFWHLLVVRNCALFLIRAWIDGQSYLINRYDLGVGFRVRYGQSNRFFSPVFSLTVGVGELLKGFKKLPVFRTTSECEYLILPWATLLDLFLSSPHGWLSVSSKHRSLISKFPYAV